MQGNLCTKSKVIYTIRQKTHVFRKRVKRERCSTPQRWSRRIRSLPPIPFNVIVPHRKIRKKSALERREKVGATKVLNKTIHRSSSKLTGERKNSVFIKKNAEDKSDPMEEVVRIVPVVVYVKNSSKPNCRSSTEKVQVEISGKLLNQAFNTYLGGKIKKEPLEKRCSRRLKMLPPGTVAVTKPKKKC